MLTKDLESESLQNDSEIAAGEELTGFVPFAVEPAEMEKLDDNNEAILEVPGIFTKKGGFKSDDALFLGTKETVPFDAKGEAKSEAVSHLYEDKATVENMARNDCWSTKKSMKRRNLKGAR